VPQWRATRAKLLAYVGVFHRVTNIVARQQKPTSAVDVDDATRGGSRVCVTRVTSHPPPLGATAYFMH